MLWDQRAQADSEISCTQVRHSDPTDVTLAQSDQGTSEQLIASMRCWESRNLLC